MAVSSDESSDLGKLAAFPWRLTEGWKPSCSMAGLIALALSDGWAQRMAIPESAESARWDVWLSETFTGESVRFGERIGSHLWVYAEIPDHRQIASQNYIESLARRIRDRLQAESDELAGISRSAAFHGDAGYAAEIVSYTDNRPVKETLYEAFLAAAFRLHGWGRAEPDAMPLQRQEMERILHEGDIRSVYQPIFELRSQRLFGYEALTRCPADSVFDGPLSLFRYAENEGYALALDRLARERAIHSCPFMGPKQKIFINVDSGIMKDPHFVSGQTRQWLAARDLHPGQVVLELTERSSIDDFEEAKRMLDHYRTQGYQIAIDDAGAGYSSLQAIVELRPDYIKLDKSLVQNADRDDMKKHMLRTFVRFAKRMRIGTVAEGIERVEELDLVRSMGIDFGQGYLIGRPSEQPVLQGGAVLR